MKSDPNVGKKTEWSKTVILDATLINGKLWIDYGNGESEDDCHTMVLTMQDCRSLVNERDLVEEVPEGLNPFTGKATYRLYTVGIEDYVREHKKEVAEEWLDTQKRKANSEIGRLACLKKANEINQMENYDKVFTSFLDRLTGGTAI